MVIGERYELGDPIGHGGWATVYRATDRVLGRIVAIKIFHSRDDEAIASFQHEARIAAQLRSPDVVAILDFGRDGDRAYIVMELLEGETLATVMREGAMPRLRALSIVRRLTAALAQLHARGVVHRDVTPSNVFLTEDGRVVLSDFGLAAVEGRDSSTTRTPTGMIIGTPRYMAPEALYGRSLDASVDVYAVGVLLYELLLGRRPHDVNADGSIRAQIRDQIRAQLRSPVLPRSVDPEFPPELETVILKALASDRTARFPTAQELLEAFDAAIVGTESEIAPDLRWQLRSFPCPDVGTVSGIAPSAPQAQTSSLQPPARVGSSPSPSLVTSLSPLVRTPRGLQLPETLSSPAYGWELHEERGLSGTGRRRLRRHAGVAILGWVAIAAAVIGTVLGLRPSAVFVVLAVVSSIVLGAGAVLRRRWHTGGRAEVVPARLLEVARTRSATLVEDLSTQTLAPLDDPEFAAHPDTLGELLVVEGEYRGARYPLTGTTTLGKDPLCEIVFDEPYVSRYHARIGVESSRVFLEDLGSSNGTLLNDRQVERVFLGHGDRITIGKTVLLYSGPAAARRLQEIAARWEDLSRSVTQRIDGKSFVAASRKLAYGLLREAIGYRVDREIPLLRGFVGFVVDAPTLWIRQRRFVLIFAALHDERRDVVQELEEVLEAGQVFEHLVVAIPVAGAGPALSSAAATAAAFGRSTGSSVRRFDLVVLDRGALDGLVRANTAEQFLQIVLEQGLAPAALSPYVLRGPVPEHMFFGRARELKVVAEGLATSSFAVVAGRRMGKSSFLQRLLRMLQSDPRYHTLHINCEARDTAARFLDAFESDGEPCGDAGAFPRRVAKLRAREHGRTIVLLLDEVDALLDHELGDGRQGSLFRVFRAAAHEGACRFVFSGSRVLYRHLHDAASPFFNFAEEILLRPIDERAVKEIVETPMTQLGIQLVQAPELLSRVIDVTSCHPNLVQILCHRIVQGAADRRATPELVDRIVGDREFQREFVETAWSESTPREKLVSLLSAEETIAAGELQARAQEHGIGNGGVQEALRMLELCSLMAQRPEGITYLLRSFPGMVRRFEDVPALVATLASGGRA